MTVPTLVELEAAAAQIYAVFPATPQTRYPLLSARAGCDVIVKHENHTPVGAFKVRGGIVYLHWLRQTHPEVRGVVTATRGNHGQSIALAARAHGLSATIFVPRGNSAEKNAAMRALGGELIEAGDDFQAAMEASIEHAEAHGLHRVPSYHPKLVAGVGTYSLELLRAHRDLDVVYVPIGLGSGISGMIAARDALGLRTEIIGVVAEAAPAYALSFQRGQAVEAPVNTFADGVACRKPDAQALPLILQSVADVIAVSEEAIADAMRIYFTDTHNLAEGAAGVALAGLLQQRSRLAGKKAGVILCGGNIDLAVYRDRVMRSPGE
jgi:threonine dehydratase